MEDNKKTIEFKTIIIAVIISVILSVFLTLSIQIAINSSVSLSDFKIESFNMDTDKTTYTYSEDSITYSGKGTVTCTDKTNDYIVLIEETNLNNKKITYNDIIVHDGIGTFGTYDSSYSGATSKPEYSFNIIGYKTFNK